MSPPPSQTTVGRTRNPNAFVAGQEAAREALGKLNGRKPAVAIVFSTQHYDHTKLIDGMSSVLGSAPLVGCSGEGVISSEGSIEVTHFAALMLIASDTIGFELFEARGLKEGSARCGRELAEQVKRSPNFARAKGLILLPDGLTVNSTQLLDELQKTLPPSIAILGGTAGDMMGYLKATHQYFQGKVSSDTVVAILISGDVELDVSVSHGCEPIGLDMKVTRANANWLEEIDGKPAWSVFREYLVDSPDELRGPDAVYLCIGQRLDSQRASVYDDYIIRTPLGMNKETGAMFLPCEIKAGAVIRMARRDPARIVSRALEMGKSVVERGRKRRPVATLQFDCAGRGGLLFGLGEATTEQIIFPLQKELGHSESWIGFHTYGEIAPIQGRSEFHNYTLVLCRLYESER